MPARQQLLARREDLLDDQIHRLAQQLGARAQQIAVADRIEQPVDVVEPQPVDVAARDQLEDERCASPKQLAFSMRSAARPLMSKKRR